MSTPLKREYSNLGFDPDALREKYRQERDKRIRPEGNDQYVEVTGKFAHFVDDPYVERIEREPLTDEVDVVVIGGGFGGLLAGARFRQAGIDDIRIVEAGGDFGGTWYWNRYPGAQCDIESYCYLPLLEELGYMPKEKYSYAPEIYEHSQRIAKAFDLYDAACFQTSVTGLQWDEASARWIVSTDRNDAMKARFVVMATGPLNRPKLPVDSRHRGLRGAHVSHESLGLRLHRRRSFRRPDETRRQARRGDRHRGDGDPMRAVRGPVRESICTCSNARRRRSICGAIRRPIRTGRRR